VPIKIRKLGVDHFLAIADSAKKSTLLRIRADLPKEKQVTNLYLFYGDGYRKSFPALCSTALDYKTSIFCSHSYKKTMCTLTRNIARLKSTFHTITPEIKIPLVK
jgi:hypothetical protein